MATLNSVIAAGALEAYELPDWERRQPIRPLWMPPEFWDWADMNAELDTRLGGRSLYEHMLQTFNDFRCSEPFPAGDLRQVMPTKKGIRKLHPPKLRIYGWCPAPHQFVVVNGALEAETKRDRKLNDRRRDEVLDFIKRHKLEDTILRGDILAVFPKS